jgi:hypothetical protein
MVSDQSAAGGGAADTGGATGGGADEWATTDIIRKGRGRCDDPASKVMQVCTMVPLQLL